MKLQELLIGILLIGAITAGLYGFMTDVSDDYGIELNDSQYIAIYDNTETLADDLDARYGNLTAGETSTSTQFFTGVILAWRVVKNIVTLPVTIMVVLVDSIAITLGFPAWIIGTVLSIITVWIIFSLMGWLRGWKE